VEEVYVTKVKNLSSWTYFMGAYVGLYMRQGRHYKEGGRQDSHVLDKAMGMKRRAAAEAAKCLPAKVNLMEYPAKKGAKRLN
jgi:hypothetical protein